MARDMPLLPRTVVFFVTFAAVGISVWFLNAYAEIFNSFFLAIMIVMTASPVGFWLQRRSVPRWLALLLSVLAALTATILVAVVLAASLVRVLDIIPEFVDSLEAAEARLLPLLDQLGITPEDLRNLASPEAIGRLAVRLIRMTLQSVSMFGLVILIVVFMVIEAFLMPLKLENRPYISEMSPEVAIHFTANIRQYVGITTLLGLIGGAVLAGILYLLQIPFALLWGVLYLVLNFVPMVGFWFALIPPLLLAITVGNPASAVLVLVAYMVVSSIINQGVKPAIMGGGLDLSPFWSIMSLIIWSAILGPLGLIVGVPLTIALKELVFSTDEQARWVADLLGAGLAPRRGEPTAILADSDVGTPDAAEGPENEPK